MIQNIAGSFLIDNRNIESIHSPNAEHLYEESNKERSWPLLIRRYDKSAVTIKQLTFFVVRHTSETANRVQLVEFLKRVKITTFADN